MPWSVRNRRLWVAGGVVVVVAAGAAVALWPAAAAPEDPEIAVSRSDCGTGWSAPKPGPQTLRVHNTDSVTTEVDLIAPDTGVIYGELEGVGPGTTRALPVDLGNGDYAFRCAPEDSGAIVGPAVHVSGGTGRPGPGAAPVTRNDLLGPLKTYQQHVNAGLAELTADTGALKNAVHGGDRAASKTAWLTAHLAYERLGAAYNAFGDSNGALNGTADGLPAGTADEGFTGFHRLEFGLWHDQDMAALAPVADRLDDDARKLQQTFADTQVDGKDLGLRAHEIMENTLQFELTGHTDYGSGTNLATARANLDGTRAVLDLLRPLLVPRYPGLARTDTWLARTQSALDGARRADGSWTPVGQLAPKQRQQLNADVSELTELLAPIATIAEPRRVS